MPEESRTEFIQFCDKKRICDACDTNRCVKNLRFKDFSHFSPFRSFMLFRRACAGKQSFPALSGVRPISQKIKKELCASTVLFSSFVWHGSLLTHILPQMAGVLNPCGGFYFLSFFIFYRIFISFCSILCYLYILFIYDTMHL